MPTVKPGLDQRTGATSYAYGTMPADLDLDFMDTETARTTYGALVGSSAATWRRGNIPFADAVQLLQGAGIGAFVLSNVRPGEQCLTVVVDAAGRAGHYKVETREQMSNIPVFSINGAVVGEYRTVEDMIVDLLENTRGALPVQLKLDTALTAPPDTTFVSAATAKPSAPAWNVELDEIEF